MYKNLNPGALGHSLPFDQTCALAKKYNFGGVDLDLGFLSNIVKTQSLQAARDWLAATGLKAGSFGLNVAWREGDSDAAYASSLPKFIEDARLAADLGCTRCVTWVMPRSDSLSYQQHFDLMVRRLTPVAGILKAFGIWLGLEFVGPRTLRLGHKYDFVHTMDGMRAVGAAIGAGNVGLLLDCFHWYTSHGAVSDIEVLPVKEVVYVHVNDGIAGRAADDQIDNERDMVGATGVVDIAGFFGALKKIGYQGPVTVEPFSAAVRKMTPEQAIAAASAALDRTMN
ncbi:MAG: sugar phosphate isomerase/epimerase [Chloroflexi bacterium]|nr:sugar phosphate isomerase/epimerase [Chloroflexota bacterium]MCL5273860.1 sugar phosphate isomerase/epimerase [Chloroflexota bacterium]